MIIWQVSEAVRAAGRGDLATVERYIQNYFYHIKHALTLQVEHLRHQLIHAHQSLASVSDKIQSTVPARINRDQYVPNLVKFILWNVFI